MKFNKNYLFYLFISILLTSCSASIGSVASEEIEKPLSDLQIVLLFNQNKYDNMVMDKRLAKKLNSVFEKKSQTKLSIERILLKNEDNESVSLEDSGEGGNPILEKLDKLIISKDLKYVMIFEPLEYTVTSGNGYSLMINYDIYLYDVEEGKKKWRTKNKIFLYGGFPSAKKSSAALVKQWQSDGIIL
jgi:hypothetical protein